MLRGLRPALPQCDSSALEGIILGTFAVTGLVLDHCPRVPRSLVFMKVWQEPWPALASFWQQHPLVLDGWERLALPHRLSATVRRLRSSLLCVLAAEELQQGMDPVLGCEVFHEEVRRILLASDLHQLNAVISLPLLHLETLNVYMAQFA